METIQTPIIETETTEAVAAAEKVAGERVEDTADGVSKALGPPTVVLGDNLVYALAARDTLTFEVQAGRVRAVTWTWDVD